MASYKPYEMDMITPKCVEKVRIIQDQDDEKRFNSKGNSVEYSSNLEQIINSMHGNTDRASYNKKIEHGNQRNVENNYDFLTYNKQRTEIIANERKNAILQKSNSFVLEDNSNMPSTSSGIFNIPVRNKDFEIAMPDLELASRNHISNINGDSDDDIERETAVIMGEGDEESTKISVAGKNHDNAQRLVMEFVKESGGVKIKQNATITKKEIDVDEEVNENHSDNGEYVNVDNLQCVNCRRIFDSEMEFKNHGICNAGYQLGLDDTEGPLYTCGLCMSGFNDLKDLDFHLKCEHSNVVLPADFIDGAQQHSNEISKVEKTAIDMIIHNRFRDVRKLLESSRVFLTSFSAEIIGHVSTNLFDRSVDRMYEKIDSLIEKKGDILKIRTSKKLSKRKRRHERNGVLSEDYDSMKVKKKKKHRNGIKKKSKKVKKSKRIEKNDLGFSSDDDLCLKDRIVLDQRLEDANLMDVDGCDVSDEICIPFYAIPERLDGKPMTFLDLDLVKKTVDLLCNSKSSVDFKSVSHIRIKRFEKEANEVIPLNACLYGYYSRKNTHFDDVKLLSELFNEHRMLNDELFPHESVIIDNKADIKLMESADIFEDNANYDTDYDSYDDGFDAATSHLLEENADLHTCTRCTAKFSSKKLLKTHLDEYHGGRKRHIDLPGNYSCDTCGETFQYIGKLLQHEMKTHSGLKYKYECEVCLKRFATSILKDGHFASAHNNVAILSCGICKMEFNEVTSLKEHYIGIHKGGKVSNGVFKAFKEEFKSENADILTATLSKMVTKYSKDSEDAPCCDICGRKFTSVGRLQQHKSVQHDGKQFRKKKSLKISRLRADEDDSDDEVDATEFIEIDVS